jgi:hypothetical protein
VHEPVYELLLGTPAHSRLQALRFQAAIRLRMHSEVAVPAAGCAHLPLANAQVLVKKEVVDGSEIVSGLKDVTATGTCVLVEGRLKQTPEGTQQVDTYPLKQESSAAELRPTLKRTWVPIALWRAASSSLASARPICSGTASRFGLLRLAPP